MNDVERRWGRGESGSYVDNSSFRPPIPVVAAYNDHVFLDGEKLNPGQARWLALRLLEAVCLLEIDADCKEALEDA